ncbi:MAG: hypothetical protein ACI4AE_03730 [Candidatus Cryptobacteroides sp.]
MKRLYFSLLFVFCLLVPAGAQNDYQPTSTWPYVYPDFMSGQMLTPKGKVREGFYNVHLQFGTLHFVDGEMVREVPREEVLSVTIGADSFVLVEGKLMKVVAAGENGFVAEDYTIDFATLNSTGGAYGSSSNSIATQALSSLEGVGGTRSNMNHMELKAGKDEGKVLPLIKKLYIVTKSTVVYASKKDVADLGIDPAELKAFYKANKIKWKEPDSLLKLADFLSTKL